MQKPRFKNRPFTDHWDQYDCLVYNGMADISFQPSRVFDCALLDTLGFEESLTSLMQKLGMGHIATTRYPLYPDYALQCLASCQVEFPEDSDRTAHHGIFTFKVNGRKYAIPFPALCSIYGFDDTKTGLYLPDSFPSGHEFWARITEEGWTKNRSTQSDINHPVLRLLVKSFGHTILCSLENSKMSAKYLALLYYAVGDRWPQYAAGAATFDVNMGSVFAHHLCQLKTLRAYKSGTREEHVGSLLTPLFRLAGIDMSLTRCISDTAGTLIDETHLRSVHFLRISTGGLSRYCYIWHHGSGKRLVPLPSDWTAIDTAQDLEFRLRPGVWMMARDGTDRRQRGARARQPREGRDPPAHSPPRDSSAALLGDFPYPDDSIHEDAAAYRRFNTSMLARIWGAVSGIQRHLSCARADDVVPPASRQPRRHDAESGPSGSRAGDDDEEHDAD